MSISLYKGRTQQRFDCLFLKRLDKLGIVGPLSVSRQLKELRRKLCKLSKIHLCSFKREILYSPYSCFLVPLNSSCSFHSQKFAKTCSAFCVSGEEGSVSFRGDGCYRAVSQICVYLSANSVPFILFAVPTREDLFPGIASLNFPLCLVLTILFAFSHA